MRVKVVWFLNNVVLCVWQNKCFQYCHKEVTEYGEEELDEDDYQLDPGTDSLEIETDFENNESFAIMLHNMSNESS